jgi:sialic acid synthase SpsE
MAIARELIKTAAIFCKADAVKFQKRSVRDLLTPEEYASPHPCPRNAYGATYGEHREFLEFSADQHAQLKRWCEEEGVEYSSSVWDLTSAMEIAALEPKFIKIPSARNNDRAMLEWLLANYPGGLHVSLGMTARAEERELAELFASAGRLGDLTLYACTSGYPVALGELCLLEISRLAGEYGGVREIGFSGHHNGISADIAAYTLGASVIERHFTLDRTWKGTDHAASLEPDGLRKLKRDLLGVQDALSEKPAKMLPVEEEQRAKLKRPTAQSVSADWAPSSQGRALRRQQGRSRPRVTAKARGHAKAADAGARGYAEVSEAGARGYAEAVK